MFHRNLNYEWFPHVKEGYYNLSSGRVVKKKEGHKNMEFDEKYNVCGDQQQLKNFYMVNEYQSKLNFDCFQCDINRGWDINGIFTTAKVMKVIDGDTYDINIYIDFDDIILRNRKCCSIRNASGIFQFRCRLYGVDTKELVTEEGKYVCKIVKDWISENSLFYCQCFGSDKYGRELVILYYDKDCKTSLNDKLLEVKTPEGLSCCKEYFGGKK